MEKILVGNRCPICGKMNSIEIYKKDFEAWQNGALIQNVMPYLTAKERELLITGTCSECWDKMFRVDDDGPACDYEYALEDVDDSEDDDFILISGDMTDEDLAAVIDYIFGK